MRPPGSSYEWTVTPYTRLRAWNVAVGVLLAAEGLVMLAMSNDLSLPVTAAWLGDDPVAVRGPVPAHTLWSVRIGPVVAAFLFLAAADHLLVASPGVVRSYERGSTPTGTCSAGRSTR